MLNFILIHYTPNLHKLASLAKRIFINQTNLNLRPPRTPTEFKRLDEARLIFCASKVGDRFPVPSSVGRFQTGQVAIGN